MHYCDEGQAYCFVWHEAMAKWGANEVGSCLYQYLTMHLDKNVKHIVLYSDSYGGQSKNSHLAAMFLSVLQNSSLEVIDHKFLLPGHRHMEKKKKKYNGVIEHPHDWAQLMRQCGKKKPFIVVEMKQQYFHDFAAIFKSSLDNKKKTESGA